eukprot:6697210-Prymnesium_polylepis.1
MDSRMQKNDCRMLFSDQMSHCWPLCGEKRTRACAVTTRCSLPSTSARITLMILMHVARCGKPERSLREDAHARSNGDRTLLNTSQSRKQCSTKRTCEGSDSSNDQICREAWVHA